jgi:hypothetical protein
LVSIGRRRSKRSSRLQRTRQIAPSERRLCDISWTDTPPSDTHLRTRRPSMPCLSSLRWRRVTASSSSRARSLATRKLLSSDSRSCHRGSQLKRCASGSVGILPRIVSLRLSPPRHRRRLPRPARSSRISLRRFRVGRSPSSSGSGSLLTSELCRFLEYSTRDPALGAHRADKDPGPQARESAAFEPVLPDLRKLAPERSAFFVPFRPRLRSGGSSIPRCLRRPGEPVDV